MQGRDVRIQGPDGAFSAYVVRPARGGAPGLLLIQYISGVNRVMRRLADEFAALGFLVACPDLFWRQQPGVQINNDPALVDPEEQARALELNAGFNDDHGIRDLLATLGYLRKQTGSAKVGCLGYCLGGRMAYLMAARSDVDCSVGYYGVNLHLYLSEAPHIRQPLLLHVAENDELCPSQTRDRILDGLKPNAHITAYVYPGARHAFALEGGRNFDPIAATLANERSISFLKQHLL